MNNQQTCYQTAYVNAFPTQINDYNKSRLFYFEMANRFCAFSKSVTDDERSQLRWETDGGKI